MKTSVALWAGKHLSAEEEVATRGLVALLRRCGAGDNADRLSRFLPEHDDLWTPDELELGAHAGPWIQFHAELEE